MSIKSILVHLDDRDTSEIILDTAAHLASHFDARITVLIVNPINDNVDLPTLAGPAELVSAAIAINLSENNPQQKRESDHLKEFAARVFRAHSLDFNLDILDGETKRILSEKSHFHDLLILSSDIEADKGVGRFSIPSNEIAVSAGCPVLVIPELANRQFHFEHPLIVWNSTQECARAVSDAMPILASSSQVSVIDTQKRNSTLFSRRENLDELFNYLALHEVDAEAINSKIAAKPIDTNDKINQVVKKKRNDLLVLGAYGHSQLRELFFNSQTRSLLQSIQVPVLLAH